MFTPVYPNTPLIIHPKSKLSYIHTPTQLLSPPHTHLHVITYPYTFWSIFSLYLCIYINTSFHTSAHHTHLSLSIQTLQIHIQYNTPTKSKPYSHPPYINDPAHWCKSPSTLTHTPSKTHLWLNINILTHP